MCSKTLLSVLPSIRNLKHTVPALCDVTQVTYISLNLSKLVQESPFPPSSSGLFFPAFQCSLSSCCRPKLSTFHKSPAHRLPNRGMTEGGAQTSWWLVIQPNHRPVAAGTRRPPNDTFQQLTTVNKKTQIRSRNLSQTKYHLLQPPASIFWPDVFVLQVTHAHNKLETVLFWSFT